VNAIKHIPNLTVNVVAALLRVARLLAISVVFFVVYKLLLAEALDGSQQILPLFGLWILSSYIVIPKIHRVLTKYYLPSYFVGRVRSSDGLLSDPVNLAFFSSKEDIHRAMTAAGWQIADKLTPASFSKAAYCALVKNSYPNAPVGNMYLFNRKQDFAYQQEVGGSPKQRHHVRFWKTPKGWYMPGGHKADWVAAATYDKQVGIKLASGQIDHKIHADIDKERDYIIKTIKRTGLMKKLEVVEHFSDAYHDRNNGGDMINTDGSMPFIAL